MRTTIAIPILMMATPALALVEAEQTIPDRPLVSDRDELELYGGFQFALTTDPEVDIADMLLMPIGAWWGLGNNLDVGLQVDTTLRPAVLMAFTPRARFAFGDSRMLAVGLSMTLPFGFLSFTEGRIGPRAVPVRLELPAFRYESSAGAVQANIGWRWTFQEGSDTKGLDANVAGLVTLGSSAFLVVDAGLQVFEGLDLDTLETSTQVVLAAGAGLGWQITRRDIIKFHVFTSDFIELPDVQFLVLYVHRWRPKLEAGADDWL